MVFTHMKPHTFRENQPKRMKKRARHGGCEGIYGGQLKGTTLNHSLSHYGSINLGSPYRSMALPLIYYDMLLINNETFLERKCGLPLLGK